MNSAPNDSEYAPYYGKYIGLVRGNDIIASLSRQRDETLTLLRSIPASRELYRYAEGKWSIRQVLGHINDTERLFAYRALSFARADAASLPGMEQDDWMRGAEFDGIPLPELAEEFDHIRRSTILLFSHLSEDAWLRTGTASGNPFTVRALAFIIAGHELHHMGIVKSRYLPR